MGVKGLKFGLEFFFGFNLVIVKVKMMKVNLCKKVMTVTITQKR